MDTINSLSEAPSSRLPNQSSLYDFRPFLSAPAVVQRAKDTGGAVKPLHIPGSQIPSPLARNISPDQLLGLKTSLVGSGPATSCHTVNGREIWLSWKRAWDLWNNHYIPGRENPLWIKKRFEHLQREEQQENSFGAHLRTMQDVEMVDANDASFSAVPDEADGGFQAIKYFSEFKEPPPFDPELGDDGIIWDDLVSNSVWCPRWVGEETLNIDVDFDQYDFLRDSHFERDRGVNCGRLPYPVLRPLLEYVQLSNGAFIKKKIWDGVTGTVFNMPTEPLEPIQDPKDAKLDTVKQMFGNSYWQARTKSVNSGIFPLDIRRITKGSPSPISRQISPLLEKPGDALLCDRRPGNVPSPFTHRDMREDDPWYVTEAQRDLIDYPPRRYPYPEQTYKPELIPVDDTIFREELESDQLKRTSYFATNLHGGTLIINGVEVRKGEVAGPLPQFAVVECPGGQIAFWFGSYGRHYLAGSEEDSYARWHALRQLEGWMYTGLSAGQVWTAKIKDRLERIKAGNRENDDEQWADWLSLIDVEKSDRITSVTYRLPLPGPVPEDALPLPLDITEPHVLFPSEQYELAWITAQRQLHGTVKSSISAEILPSSDLFFPGSKNRIDCMSRKALTTEYVTETWRDHGESIEQLQKLLVHSIRQREKEEAEAEAKRLKSFGLHAENGDGSFYTEPRTTQLKDIEPFHLHEKESEVKIHESSDRQLQQGLTLESIRQIQRDWTRYTSAKREEKRKLAEEGASAPDDLRRKTKQYFGGLDLTQADELKRWSNAYGNVEQPYDDNPIQKEKNNTALMEYVKHLGQHLCENNNAFVEAQQIKEAKKPRAILNYTPRPSNDPSTSPSVEDLGVFDDSPPWAYGESEEDELKQALALSTKEHRDNLQQAFKNEAIAAHVSVSEYLGERGFMSMQDYLDDATKSQSKSSQNPPQGTDPQQWALDKFQEKLRQAYEDGSRAQARLKKMRWAEFTRSEFGVTPSAWLDKMMRQTWVTVNDMPLPITSESNPQMEDEQRAKWSRLWDLLIQASDFEAQTKAATDLPTEAHIDGTGRTFAVI